MVKDALGGLVPNQWPKALYWQSI